MMQIPETRPRVIWNKSLVARLSRISILTVIAALVSVGGVHIWIANQAQKESVRKLQEKNADSIALMISSYLGNAVNELQLFERIESPGSLTLHEQKKSIEKLLINRGNLFSQITLLSESGMEKIRISGFHTFLPGELGNRSSSPGYIKAIKGELYLSGVYISPDSGLLSVEVAIPVKNVKISGVIITEVNITSLWQDISRFKIGKTGYSYLVDNKGHFVAYQESSKVLQRYGEDMGQLPPVAEFISGIEHNERKTYEYAGLNGRFVVGLYSPIPSSDWAVVVEWPSEEAYASVRRMFWFLLGLLVLGAIIAGTVGFTVSRHLVKPIHLLTNAAQKIASGDLKTPISLDNNREDEVGVLTEAFYNMQRELQNLYANLEQKFIEIAQSQEALRNSEEQLRHSQKMEALGLLASGVAHDFNNILGGIIGTISLLRYQIAKGKTENSSDLDKDLALVENTCENGAEIVSQLLSLSRKETDFELHPLDINELMRNVTNICIKSFDRSISISVNEFNEKAFSMINGPQIQQSLLNLCINASHSMTIMRKEDDPQGGHLEVGITKIFADRFFLESHPYSKEGEYWRLYVKDTGIGMDSSTLSKIFDPFFTTKTRTSIKGTGLGLSVVYSTIKAHKGFIDVYSEVGTGSVFSVYLPVAKTDNMFSGTVFPDLCTGEGTVLVIDDEKVIRNYTKAMLEECGYQVITAENGVIGLSLYKEKKTGIIAVLLDIVMPEKPGYETLVELKKLNPDIPVLMTSGLYSNDLIENVKKAGAADFIEKPYSIIQLSQKIHSILEKKNIT